MAETGLDGLVFPKKFLDCPGFGRRLDDDKISLHVLILFLHAIRLFLKCLSVSC